jgi:hypothetical protein
VFDTIGANHHRQCIPTNEALDATFELLITREKRFEAMRNGIGVGSISGERQVNALYGSVSAEAFENFCGDFGAARLQKGIERLDPLLDL